MILEWVECQLINRLCSEKHKKNTVAITAFFIVFIFKTIKLVLKIQRYNETSKDKHDYTELVDLNEYIDLFADSINDFKCVFTLRFF